MCAKCTTTKPYEDREFRESEAFIQKLEILASRVDTDSAVCPCDDPKNWNYRKFLCERRQLMRD